MFKRSLPARRMSRVERFGVFLDQSLEYFEIASHCCGVNVVLGSMLHEQIGGAAMSQFRVEPRFEIQFYAGSFGRRQDDFWVAFPASECDRRAFALSEKGSRMQVSTRVDQQLFEFAVTMKGREM